METYHYSIICWPVAENQVYGKLIGTDVELVECNVQKLKRAFSEWVKKESAENDFFDEPEIDRAHLKFRTIQIRLAYREAKGTYPSPSTLVLKVAAVHGNNQKEGYSKCYLPYLDEEFYYYDAKQLDTLIDHFVQETCESRTPETACRYVMASDPWLEEIYVRISDKPKIARIDPLELESENFLRGKAERLPYERKIRKKLKIFPEVAWEQSDHINQLIHMIYQEKANLIVVGESGAGKTTLLMDTIRKLSKQSKKEKSGVTYWRTTAQRLIADARFLGEWQEHCEVLIDAIEMVNGVLWIQDIEQLASVGGDGVEDSVAAFILPYIEQGKLQIIGEMTPMILEKLRYRFPGFIAHFQMITITPLDSQKMVKVQRYFRQYTETNLATQVSKLATETAYRLLNRYVKYASFPGKFMQFMADCVKQAQQDNRQLINEVDVLTQFIKMTGLPEMILKDELLLDSEQLQDFFCQRLLGQESVVESLMNVIKIFKAGLNDPDKPIATLMFAGPTGVGKTEASKALADYFFSAGQAQKPLFRLDMSEFQYPWQIARLIGQKEGKPSAFIQHVRQRPFSVLLFDEIEKADASIFDVLLNLFDEGRLTDASGRVTDFRNTIIILTTNLGAKMGQSIGFVDQTESGRVAEIQAFFRPEFYNRIDQVVMFKPLSEPVIKAITQKELAELQSREGIQKRQLKLSFSTTLIDSIAAIGFHAKYGARPLQRVIEQKVVSAIGQYLLSHPEYSGRLMIDFVADQVVIICDE